MSGGRSTELPVALSRRLGTHTLLCPGRVGGVFYGVFCNGVGFKKHPETRFCLSSGGRSLILLRVLRMHPHCLRLPRVTHGGNDHRFMNFLLLMSPCCCQIFATYIHSCIPRAHSTLLELDIFLDLLCGSAERALSWNKYNRKNQDYYLNRTCPALLAESSHLCKYTCLPMIRIRRYLRSTTGGRK